MIQGLVNFITPAISQKLKQQEQENSIEIKDVISEIYLNGNISQFNLDSSLKKIGFKQGLEEAISDAEKLVTSKINRLETLVDSVEQDRQKREGRV